MKVVYSPSKTGMTLAASLKEQFDDLLGKVAPGSVVGVDIGSHSVKVCELSGSVGKFKIERFGIFPLSEAALIEDEMQKPDEILQAVMTAASNAGIKSKFFCIGLFGPNTMTKRLNVPEGSREEMEDNVLWEAEQYITFGADDSQIDFHILGDNEGGGKDALVAAAKNELIENFIELFKKNKLTIKVFDLNVLALSNVFEESYADNIDEYSTGTLLLDIGAQTTKIVVFKRGGPIFTKEIAVGGSLVTEEIQRQMGLSYEEAEDLKKATDQKGNLPQEVKAIIDVQVDAAIEEIRRNINFYVTQGSAEKVNYMFVTGGSSLLPGFLDKLSANTGIGAARLELSPTFKVNDRIDINPEELSAIASIVVGLGMRKDP